MSQGVVSVNFGVLLPVLAGPRSITAVILVADVVAQHLRPGALRACTNEPGRRTAVATFAGLGIVARDARQTLCLPGGGPVHVCRRLRRVRPAARRAGCRRHSAAELAG